MPKKLITEQQVINAVKLLVINGKPLTLAAVRMHLGSNGSDSTMHKYLKKWKEECFKKAVISIDEDIIQINQSKISKGEEILEKTCNLEKTLSKQITQNEQYAQELINAEKTNVALKAEIHQLQTTIQKLQLELTEIKIANNCLEQIIQEIQSRLELNDNKTIVQQQQLIEALRAELKELNTKSMKAMQELSSSGHELLMQEKVTSINLQAKIDGITKELLENKKQLELANFKAHVHIQSLQRQIDQQQKILKNYLNLAQLQELAQRMEVNYALEVGCGK